MVNSFCLELLNMLTDAAMMTITVVRSAVQLL